jgi:hypothetical protein
LLRQVNVTSRENGGNLAVLKPLREGAPLPWPSAFLGATCQDRTRRLNQLAADAVNVTRTGGPVAARTLDEMRDHVGALREIVRANVNDLTPAQWVQAQRFLNQLADAIVALQQSDSARDFTAQGAARGKTAADLVAHMSANGLKFAPAANGDEAAYTAAYHALVAWHNSLVSPVVRAGSR